MSNTDIILKKSSVANKIPSAIDLQYGELALNYRDGILYYKTATNQISRFLDSDGIAAATVNNAQNFNGDSAGYYLDYNNLVNTPSRYTSFDSDFTAKTTSDLTEGTNLYHTLARVNTAIDDRVTKTFVNNLAIDAATLGGNNSSYFRNASNITSGTLSNSRLNGTITSNTTGNAASATSLKSGRTIALLGDVTGSAIFDGTTNVSIITTGGYSNTNFDSDFTTKTTSDLAEGTNLYHTLGRANSAIDTRVNKSFVDALNIDYDALANKPNYLQVKILTDFDDLDDIVDNGYYGFANKNVSNRPAAIKFGNVIVQNDGAHPVQLAFGGTSGNEYISVRRRDLNVWQPWSHFYNSVNDGSGSGLDADTVDGLEALSFLRSDADDTFTGTLSYSPSNTPALSLRNSTWSSSELLIGGWSSASTNGVSRIRNSNENLHLDAAENGDLYLNYHSPGVVYINGFKAWHAGNDGTGSTLDADLLDGQHGTFYLNASNINAGTISDARLPSSISSNITGNAASSSSLETPRTISLTGDVSGSTSFDGTGNVSISTAVNRISNQWSNSTGNMSGFVNDGGGNLGIRFNATPGGSNSLVENGIAYEFDIGNDSTIGDFVINRGSTANGLAGDNITWNQSLRIDGSDGKVYANNNFVGDLEGNASSSSSLETPRTISLTGDVSGSTSFDGTGNVSIDVNYIEGTLYDDNNYAGNYTVKSGGYGKTSPKYPHLVGGTLASYSYVTFQEAVRRAAEDGSRLPTIGEMEAQITAGTGGGFDAHQCWSSTQVPGKPGYVYTIIGTGIGPRTETPIDNSTTASVRVVRNVNSPTISSSELTNSTQLIIYNSSGAAVKTLYGAGS